MVLRPSVGSVKFHSLLLNGRCRNCKSGSSFYLLLGRGVRNVPFASPLFFFLRLVLVRFYRCPLCGSLGLVTVGAVRVAFPRCVSPLILCNVLRLWWLGVRW